MKSKLISLKPKPTVSPTRTPQTNVESNPAYSDKTSFPTIARKDELPLKRKPSKEPGADKPKRNSAPIHIHREPNYTRNTQ